MRDLNWVVKHQVDFNKEYDLLETLLTSAGVTDIDEFLNVNKSHIFDGMLLQNMDKAIDLLHNTLHTNDIPRIFVKVDSDVDGFTSAAYIVQFINKITNNQVVIDFKISLDKTHGINDKNDIGENKYDLVIIPDAGSEDVEECKLINDKGIPILILDHHNFDKPEIHQYATLVNCTDGSYPNSTLSGVGVVHKFCIEYCKAYGLSEEVANYYLDLVSFGMIADSMDMRNLETRYYALEGLKDKYYNNDFINELFLRNPEDIKFGRTIHKTGWVFAPKLNAIVRYGTEEEQIDTFRAMIGIKEDREYQPRRAKGADKNSPLPPKEVHSLQKTMARICDNAKSRQDTGTRKTIELCTEEIKNNHLDKNNVIVLDATKLLSKGTITGLVANKIASIYKRPTLILTQYDKQTYGGSGRGYGKGSVLNFRQMLEDTGLFSKCAGHDNAFGILVDKKHIPEVIQECNKKIEPSDLVQVYEVDYEIKADNLKEENIFKIANAYNIWGNGIEEPVFAVTDIHIPASYVNGYTKENSSYVGYISFVYNHLTFFKRYCAKTDFEELTLKDRTTLGKNKKNLKINLICKFVLTEIDGAKKPQIMIMDFQTVEDEAKPLQDFDDFETKILSNHNKKTAIDIDDDFVF